MPTTLPTTYISILFTKKVKDELVEALDSIPGVQLAPSHAHNGMPFSKGTYYAKVGRKVPTWKVARLLPTEIAHRWCKAIEQYQPLGIVQMTEVIDKGKGGIHKYTF